MKYETHLNADLPRTLLKACPTYQASPLHHYQFQDRTLLLKDETARMGLNAFKALGGVYAVAKLIEARIGKTLSPQDYLNEEVKNIAKGLTFVCASAGNHGMAVAAGAKLFGANARIHLAETVPEAFVHRLQSRGAEVVRSGADYEASINAAIADAEATGAIHLADGSWPGYTEPPRLVMEGYTVMAEEMRQSLEDTGQWPSHVYLQAGVGGLAAANAFMIRSNWSVQPKIIIVEPEAAPCLKDSIASNKIETVQGSISNMGRLDCKTPSLLAYEILKDCADEFVTISDAEAETAVHHAADLGLSTTPSGAAGLAACLSDNAERSLVIISEGGISDD